MWPSWGADSGSAYTKDFQFGQCLDIDHVQRGSKFGEVKWPRSQPNLYFAYRHYTNHSVKKLCFETLICNFQDERMTLPHLHQGMNTLYLKKGRTKFPHAIKSLWKIYSSESHQKLSNQSQVFKDVNKLFWLSVTSLWRHYDKRWFIWICIMILRLIM